MRYLHLLLFCSLSVLPANACMNLTEHIPGVFIEDVEYYRLGFVEIDRESLETYIKQRSADCGKGLTKRCNDLVIAQLFHKDFAKALELSTRLVVKFSQDYSVVITHAAALELNGKTAEAIPFMERALLLNPKSHKGSEWIHLRILQQRVQGDAGVNPWALIGVDLRPDSLPEAPDSLDLRALLTQTHYQVNDRHFFTPKHDPLYGALLFAYADLLHLNGFKSQAKGMYEWAAGYGFTYAKKEPEPVPDVPAAEPDTLGDQFLEKKVEEVTKKDSKAGFYSWLFIGAVVCAVGLFIWRNRAA